MRGEQHIHAVSLGMSPKKAADAGEHIPLPEWWRLAIAEVREVLAGDATMIDDVARETGRIYSKFQISRYFKPEDPTTTIQLTEDLWVTYGARYEIPRPCLIAQSRTQAIELMKHFPFGVSMVPQPTDDNPTNPAKVAAKRALQAHRDRLKVRSEKLKRGSQSGVLPPRGEPGEKKSRRGVGSGG